MASRGALLDATTLTLTVYSRNASRIEARLYQRPKAAEEIERIVLAPQSGDQSGLWSATISLAQLQKHAFDGAIYYGLRAWGPNWRFDTRWQKGSEIGFSADVDDAGNRFNPNKLLIDPYAVELSHDPAPRLSSIDPNEWSADYDSGPGLRSSDTGAIAPKSVVPLCALDATTGQKPTRPLRDDVIYEVHVPGLTKNDPSIPERYRGTFRGAGMKAASRRDFGITAVEFLPVHHFASEQNDDGDPRGDNYWGYMTLGFFAPNRRYASDRTPGGPIREFKEMVRAFHAAGIKVFLDVVYNHTGEGLLARTSEGDDSRCDDACQPWAVGNGTYQLGRFPDGWAEWNDLYRKTLRFAENRVGSVLPWQVANALSGSEQQFRQGSATRSTPEPSNSINYVSSHDGLTLRDLFSYTDGEDAWDHGGARAEQRKAVRNALALLMTSAGVPMLLAGDELFRTQDGRANTVAIDDTSVYLDWANVDALLRAQAADDRAALMHLRQRDDVCIFEFAREMIRFRARQPALRPTYYRTGNVQPGRTLEDLAWYGPDGQELTRRWDDPELGFLAFRVDARAQVADATDELASTYIAYCWRDGPVDLILPAPQLGTCWRRVADTAEWMESRGNFDAQANTMIDGPYRMHARSVAIFIER